MINQLQFTSVRKGIAWVAAWVIVLQVVAIIINGNASQYPIAALVVGLVAYIVVMCIAANIAAVIVTIAGNAMIAVLNTVIAVVVFVFYPVYLIATIPSRIAHIFS